MVSYFNFCQGDSPVLQFIGKWGARVYDERGLIQMYIHLVLAALFPIYIGSHASLQRPPSAPAPKNLKTEDEDDDEIEPEPVVEGLSPSDAIMFPVLAGVTLAILYFIIKWLEDPAILNRIMGWYFSGLGVFGIGKLAGDGLNVATTFLFPSVWSSGKDIYHVSTFFEPTSPKHNVPQVMEQWRLSVCIQAFWPFLYAYSRRHFARMECLTRNGTLALQSIHCLTSNETINASPNKGC